MARMGDTQCLHAVTCGDDVITGPFERMLPLNSYKLAVFDHNTVRKALAFLTTSENYIGRNRRTLTRLDPLQTEFPRFRPCFSDCAVAPWRYLGLGVVASLRPARNAWARGPGPIPCKSFFG
jgi:hypothetical protein